MASAAAFGPSQGLSQGDDPQAAALAVDGSAGTVWHTDWYTTASLGGLQSGTGLLLSLGKTATIASATIVLGATHGRRHQGPVQAGDTPALADLPVVAQAANPGGTLTMRPDVPSPGPLPADLVHQPAARQCRHLRGQHLRRPAIRHRVAR